MMDTGKQITKSEYKNLVIVFLIGIYAGIMLITVIVFKGTKPQPMLDAWSIAHLCGGFCIGYLLSIYRKWSITTLIFVALIPQILWEIFECIMDYTIYTASISNNFMDVVLGSIGVLVSTYVADYCLYKRRICGE